MAAQRSRRLITEVSGHNRERQRRDFMVKLYDETGGNTDYAVVMYEIGEEIGLGAEETNVVCQYLIGEGLIELMSYDRDVRLTHRGVVEVEATKAHPERATEHFPPVVNITNVQTMIGSQIQQGTQHSTQAGTFRQADLTSIKQFLDLLKSELPNLPLSDEDRAEVQSDVETVQAQVASSRPKRDIIGACMTGIRDLAKTYPASVCTSTGKWLLFLQGL